MGSQAEPAEAPASAAATVTAEPGQPAAAIGGDDGVYRILVVGDALAGGLGAGMTRMATDDPRFAIINRFNESSGLARPEVYDWAAAVPKIMATQPFDAAVIHVGVNDRQGIRSADGRLVFRAPEWVAAYEAQIDALLDALKAQGVKIFWVSLPPMADPTFDADMQFLAALHRKHVEAKGGTYIDIRAQFLGADGQYADRGPDDTGTDRKLRARDGITFLKQGNNRWGQLVMAAIKSAIGGEAPPANAPATTAPAATDPAVVASPITTPQQPETSPAQPVASGPVFGQEGLNGETLTLGADTIATQARTSAAKKAQTAQAAPIHKEMDAAQGSAAEQLFTQGVIPKAPAGRFDDFSYVAPAQ